MWGLAESHTLYALLTYTLTSCMSYCMSYSNGLFRVVMVALIAIPASFGEKGAGGEERAPGKKNLGPRAPQVPGESGD